MFDKQMNKLKDVFKNKEGNNKKKIENLVFFIVVLVITIIGINIILKDDSDNEIENVTSTKVLAEKDTSLTNNIKEEDLESELEDILSKIDGVGETHVLVTYSQSKQFVALYNEDNTTSDTEEKDSRGWK